MKPASVEAEKIRIQFDLLPERVEELHQLMVDCGVDTRKDIFNNAITLLEWAVAEVKMGHEIASLNKANKSYEIVRMPIFSNVAKRNSMKEQPISTVLEERKREAGSPDRAAFSERRVAGLRPAVV
ncbi:hypothetical protein LC092_16820 [Stappia stellulata]|uniref:hypothetical protein n=1 Tax=Stappia stellulata TaxID=71235 RepID=UPI001CD7BC69|nr:hypothetical protein [Stappia stellulata]MCA1244109.1 hypothetical protein [Stappia stellulata]